MNNPKTNQALEAWPPKTIEDAAKITETINAWVEEYPDLAHIRRLIVVRFLFSRLTALP